MHAAQVQRLNTQLSELQEQAARDELEIQRLRHENACQFWVMAEEQGMVSRPLLQMRLHTQSSTSPALLHPVYGSTWEARTQEIAARPPLITAGCITILAIMLAAHQRVQQQLALTAALTGSDCTGRQGPIFFRGVWRPLQPVCSHWPVQARHGVTAHGLCLAAGRSASFHIC